MSNCTIRTMKERMQRELRALEGKWTAVYFPESTKDVKTERNRLRETNLWLPGGKNEGRG